MPRLFRFALAVVLYAAVTAPAHGQSTIVAEAAPATSRPAPAPLSVQQIFEQSAPAVVLIAQYDANDKMTSLGSGFAVSPNGVIVTNNHVITPDPGAVRIAVKVPNGRVFTNVRIIYTDARRDIAILSVNATGLPRLKIGDSDAVQVGDEVVAIGNPEGLELTITSGIIEGIRLDPGTGTRFIQHQAPISHGSSGGPLLNMRGEVIGINAFMLKDAQNINGAVPINYAKPYFHDTATTTWEEYARVAPTPAASRPTPAVPPLPGRPAPSGRIEPGVYFEGAADYRQADDSFRLGFAASLYDTVSMFAAAAKDSGDLSGGTSAALFYCLAGHASKLGQLSGWVATTAQAAANDQYPVVLIVAQYCAAPFQNVLTFWESGTEYLAGNLNFQLGFAAGMADTASLLAMIGQNTGTLSSQGTTELFTCLDSHGDKLGEFASWVNTVLAGASPDDSAAEVIAQTCMP